MTDANKLSRVSAIVFDLDDTLFDADRWTIAALRHAGRLRGLQGETVDAAIDAYLAQHGAPDAGILNEILLRNLQPDSGGAIRMLCQAANRFNGGSEHWELYPGVREALQELSRRYRLALIAEGPVEAQQAKVKALGLQRLMRTVVYSDQIDGLRSRRPDARPFRELRDRLELPSNQILFVGDDPAKDFETPNFLGFLTCRVLTGPFRDALAATPQGSAGYELASVARLPELMALPQIDLSSYLHLPFLKQPEYGSAPLQESESMATAANSGLPALLLKADTETTAPAVPEPSSAAAKAQHGAHAPLGPPAAPGDFKPRPKSAPAENPAPPT